MKDKLEFTFYTKVYTKRRVSVPVFSWQVLDPDKEDEEDSAVVVTDDGDVTQKKKQMADDDEEHDEDMEVTEISSFCRLFSHFADWDAEFSQYSAVRRKSRIMILRRTKRLRRMWRKRKKTKRWRMEKLTKISAWSWWRSCSSRTLWWVIRSAPRGSVKRKPSS